jgi:flagellar capping protein FliD
MSNEELTLDELARRTQDEFATLRGEVKEDVGRILQAIADLDLHLSAVASSWHTQFDALAERVSKLEEHLHFKR